MCFYGNSAVGFSGSHVPQRRRKQMFIKDFSHKVNWQQAEPNGQETCWCLRTHFCSSGVHSGEAVRVAGLSAVRGDWLWNHRLSLHWKGFSCNVAPHCHSEEQLVLGEKRNEHQDGPVLFRPQAARQEWRAHFSLSSLESVFLLSNERHYCRLRANESQSVERLLRVGSGRGNVLVVPCRLSMWKVDFFPLRRRYRCSILIMLTYFFVCRRGRRSGSPDPRLWWRSSRILQVQWTRKGTLDFPLNMYRTPMVCPSSTSGHAVRVCPLCERVCEWVREEERERDLERRSHMFG